MNSAKPLDPLEVLQRLDWAESNDLEFKAARGGLPKSLWETYCAMANSNGGVILLGVEDDGRVSGQDGLTVAGLLMFGSDEALREALPQYHVDYRERLSADPEQRWSHRLHPDGTWPANLFQFFLRTILRLTRDLDLPFQLGSDLLRKGETPVHEAIREALVNALVHADYQGVGGVLVEKYPDRLVFANPGSLLVSPEQLLRGSVSECRNKALQTMFLMMGAAEKAGSGMDKIRSGWESQHWRQPLVQELSRPDRVRWVLPMVSLLPEASLERLRGLFGTRFETCSKLEVQALVTAEVEGVVDNLRLQQITGNHSRDVTALLQALVARDMLLQEGRGRWTRYRLPVATDIDDSVPNDSSCVHKGEHSVHSVPADSVHKPDSSAHSESAESERQMLERLAAPARHRQRMAPQEMESLILQLCRDRWLTRRELAGLLQRNADSLRSRFLTPMVEHGLLCMRYPDTPNRSDQAYSAALAAG